MKKINFVNKPNTTTPINDTNLNKMQDNIEEAINEIPMKVLSNGYDIDILKKSGTYGIFNATGTLPNGFSTTDNNIFIQCFMWFENYGRQILRDVRTNKTFSRNLNNGVWQTWVSYNYSTEEIFTGKYWIDGKKIYRKIIDFQRLPNATTKIIPHNISNFAFPTFIYGIAFENGTTNYYPLPLQYTGSSSDYNVEILITPTNVNMTSSKDRSNYFAYIILEYTKTTD